MRAPKSSVMLIATLTLLVSCSEARLQREPPPEPLKLDNLLTVKGEFCTEPSAQVSFPLKVLFLIDQSASLQCTDQDNKRFDALGSTLSNLRRRPNANFAAIGFSSWARTQEFTRQQDALSPFVTAAGGLGTATDYQGSLAQAVKLLEEDMQNVGPAERARTRYVVTFVSDGIPEPRCNAGCEDDGLVCADGEDNDGDGRIDAADPECADIGNNDLHPDNLYGICNTTIEIPEGEYVDFTGVCPEYNQPRQILQRVQEVMALKDLYSVGSITLNTVFLADPQEKIEAICPDAAAQFAFNREKARPLLQSMANAGNGTFRDVVLSQEDTSFLNFDVTSINAEQVLTTMSINTEHARRQVTGELVTDSDRDGLGDDREFELQSDRNKADTDGDGYQDGFEETLKKEGFDPVDKDKPAIACENKRDGDGDGLRDCEEAFLGTDPNQPDTDKDGILDREEMLTGTNPVEDDGLVDLDFDGVLNADEYLGGTHPLRPDAEQWRSERIVYDVDERGLTQVEDPNNGKMEERRCYDYNVARIPLVATPLVRDRGLNRVLVTTSERLGRVSGVPSEIRLACFEAFYNGDTIKSPESGIIDVTQAKIDEVRQKVEERMGRIATCGYFTQPEDEDEVAKISRGDLTKMVGECLPRKIELDGKLYKREELEALIERHIQDDGGAKLPVRAFDLFVPIQNYNPETDCWRPWELDLVNQFLVDLEADCRACAAELEESK